jgi:hypothetical protein
LRDGTGFGAAVASQTRPSFFLRTGIYFWRTIMGLGDIYEVVCKVKAPAGDISLCRFDYIQSTGIGDPTVFEMQAIAEAFDAAIAAAFIGAVSISYVYGQTEVKIRTGLANSRFAVSVATGGTGGGSLGTDGPSERALVVRKHTGVAGRRNQGRNFIPAPCQEAFTFEGTYVPGNPDAALHTALLTALLATVNGVAGGLAATWSLVIWHPALLTTTPVITLTISQLVGTQRRRRIGVGE